MKNLMNCAKKAIICAIMAFVFLFNSVVPASAATDPATGMAIIQTIVGVAQGLGDNPSSAEKQELREMVYTLFRSSPDSMDSVWVEADQLHDLYLELCQLGFPCKISYDYDLGRYVIEGTGYMCIPNSFLWVDDYVNLDGRIFTNPDGLAYSAYDPTSSNQLLLNIYNYLGSHIYSAVNNIYGRVVALTDYLMYSSETLYDKFNEVVIAIEGISDSAANFDTTPITDKLQEVISSADANFSALLTDLSTNTDRIVSAIPDPVDLSAVNSRIDAVVEEVQKISTFADLHEVVTVTPGVLGDVNVVTTGGWVYDYLSFHYEYVEPEFSAVANTEYISGSWFIDYDSGTGSYIYELQDRNYVGANAVRFSAADNYWVPDGASPVYIEVNYHYGDPLVLDVGDLKGTPYTVSLDEVTYARIYVESGGDRWLEDTGGGALVGITYGDFSYPVADQLSFTVDGVPHTLYFTNEYEFDSCSYGDFIAYDENQDMWYLENLYGSGGTVPLTYYNAYLTDALTSAPTTTTTMEGETYTWFEWFYTSYKGGGSVDVTPIVNKLKDIENALSNMGSTIDIENNTNININEGDENYNIFYVDDPGGEDKSIVDLSGDTLTVFGKLLNFLYKVGFKGALDNAGGGIGDLSDFYLDTSEGSADLWAS